MFDNKNEAFGLPKGTITAIFAGSLIFGTVYLCIITKDTSVLVGLAGAAVMFYFNKNKKEEVKKD